MARPGSSRDANIDINKDIIGHATSVEEIIDALARRGCSNLTSSIDMAASGEFPCAGGGFCDVYRGMLRDGTNIAIKVLRVYDRPGRESEKQKLLKRAARELYLWSKLQHHNVLPLMGLSVFRGHISMISEWMENGSLLSYLRLSPDANRIELCMDICAGLCYIHENGMVHGDLKAANIMVSSDGTALIADFGNAELRELTLKFTNTTTGGVSIRWTAPELLLADGDPEVSKEADVYAYGMTVLEVITGKLPFEGIGDNRVISVVAYERKTPPRPDTDMPDALWSLLISCWAQGPTDRPRIASLNDRLQALFQTTASCSSKSTSGLRTTVSSGSGGSRRRTLARNQDPLSPINLEKRGYHTFTTMGRKFHVEKRWKFVRELGQGAYGFVVSAQDQISGETVAIKLVTRLFEKIQLSKRALREISLLRHFANHENITGLIDMDVITPDFNEIYLFMEPMEADLHQIIRSGQRLSNAHVQYFLYQILRAMKYVHSAGVIHRDLKPGNLLVNADCELKICDFGLSRGFDSAPGSDDGAGSMTGYVATRWYRAPEIMLSFHKYSTAIDIWSVGCILGELLGMKPMFKGKDYIDQLNVIIDILGTPDEEVLKQIGSVKAQAYIRRLPVKQAKPFGSLFPQADDLALDLLSKMISFDPTKRPTVSEALKHPYLEAYHDEDDEPECESRYEHWKEIEKLETTDQFRAAIWNEVEEFRREVREMAVEPEATAAVNSAEAVSDATPETPFASDAISFSQEQPASTRTKSSVDPYEIYARRSSNLNSASDTMTGTLPPEVVDPKDPALAGQLLSASYVVPARSRGSSATDGAMSSATFPRTILRTLSTLSVNDSGAAGTVLAVLGQIKDEEGSITAADAPPSPIPVEFRPKKQDS